MASLRQVESDRQVALEGRHLVGRSPRCSLRLDDPSVSGEHALLRWTGRGWTAKDLGSRFGTFLDGKALNAGVTVRLNLGARLAVGRDKSTWVLEDAGEPELMVVTVQGGPALLRNDGMIAIPSQERPTAVLYQNQRGDWVLEEAGKQELVREEVPFVVEGQAFRLCNTSPVPLTSMLGTAVGASDAVPLAECGLRFVVSRDEEKVRLEVVWRDRVVDLGVRAHHYTLVTLARILVRERGQGRPQADSGWVEQEELLRQLQFSPERLNLDIFRARRQLSAAGFVPAAGIVERKPGTRELRIGVCDCFVESGTS
jgi:hypothetical protein